MKNILKPIFEMVTGQYILFDNIIYNYIAIAIIGVLAFKIAWNLVGNLYDSGIIIGRRSGSLIHWLIRIIMFIIIFYLCSAIIWLTKFIFAYRTTVLIIIGTIAVFVIIYKNIKKIKKMNKPIVLKENTRKRINNSLEMVNIAAGILSTANPEFSIIPIFVYAVNRTLGLASEEYITERIKKINEKLEEKKININDFKEKMLNLSQHNEYIVLNHLRNIILTCIPEMVDIYIEVLLDFIMKKEYKEKEEICEIVNQLNRNDLELLKMIKEYSKNGKKEFYNKNQEKEDKKIKDKNEIINNKNQTFKRVNFVDRNVVINNRYTIFWKDFEKYYELQSAEMGLILLFNTIDENDKPSNKWAYIGRSFIKLQNLGIIEMDYINTTGNINSLNIDRFHVTLFGKIILSYIKL